MGDDEVQSVGPAALREVKRRMELFPNHKGSTLHPVLIAASGASQKTKDSETVLTLDDLF